MYVLMLNACVCRSLPSAMHTNTALAALQALDNVADAGYRLRRRDVGTSANANALQAQLASAVAKVTASVLHTLTPTSAPAIRLSTRHIVLVMDRGPAATTLSSLLGLSGSDAVVPQSRRLAVSPLFTASADSTVLTTTQALLPQPPSSATVRRLASVCDTADVSVVYWFGNPAGAFTPTPLSAVVQVNVIASTAFGGVTAGSSIVDVCLHAADAVVYVPMPLRSSLVASAGVAANVRVVDAGTAVHMFSHACLCVVIRA